MPALTWGLVSSLVVVLALIGGSARGDAAAFARNRTISFYNIHSKETITVEYMKDGKRLPAAMEQINWILRDWRRDEATTMDPDLIDLAWEIHNELGSVEPIHIISGYRSRATNEMLRHTVGGQARESRHILGKAMDVYFPDVPLRKLRYSALIQERGGVGYYPTSAIPFVHIDTDRVRAWPRLPRSELALLFPSGHTQHVPEDGGELTRDDARSAKADNPELAQQLAAFHTERAQARVALRVASLAPSLPRLLALPRPAVRPAPAATQVSEADRARLAAMAEAPQLLRQPTPLSRNPRASARGEGDASAKRGPAAFAMAPAYDEEHPEELSYRPFPIAPLLTPSASADCQDLARLSAGDLGKALDMIDDGAGRPVHLRLSFRAAQLMWAQQFKGEAVDLSSVARLEAAGGANSSARRVASEPR